MLVIRFDYRSEFVSNAIADWRIDFNIKRPHSERGDLTPTEFAAWSTATTSTREAP